jgi:thymidylate synthase
MRREALGFSANDAWLSAFKMLEESPCCGNQESRSGATKEVLRGSICIDDPTQRWVVARHPALNLPFALAETIWILQGRSDSAFLNYFNGQLPKYAGHEENYHGAYGFRLRSHLGFDQLERAYQALRNNQDGRQVVLQIWDSKIDLPDEMGSPASPDVPCNIVAFLKIRNKRLEWTQVMRSNDLFRGLPYNIVQFTTLQEVMAGWLGVELGQYYHFADSLHYYLDDKASFALENCFPA